MEDGKAMISVMIFAGLPVWARLATPVCFLLAFGIATALGAAGHSASPLAGPVAAEVERVVDGDTLLVRARIWLGQEVRVHVRVAGIDTPELRARCAPERLLAAQAREFTGNFLGQPAANRDGTAPGPPAIWLHDIGQDKFGGRVLARVRNQAGADLAGALVQAGFARFYEGGRRAGWCPEAKPGAAHARF